MFWPEDLQNKNTYKLKNTNERQWIDFKDEGPGFLIHGSRFVFASCLHGIKMRHLLRQQGQKPCVLIHCSENPRARHVSRSEWATLALRFVVLGPLALRFVVPWSPPQSLNRELYNSGRHSLNRKLGETQWQETKPQPPTVQRRKANPQPPTVQ